MEQVTGIIFNIQRYTIHDGPGVRTEVFFKGCSLHCKWCSNPESLSPRPELGVYPNKCLGEDVCGDCVKHCPLDGAPLRFEQGKIAGVDRALCKGCLKCTSTCFLAALKPWGKRMTVEEVMAEVLADRMFYEQSGGGVTLSGGEVTLQPDFAAALLQACREQHIHTCVETCMHCDPAVLRRLWPLCDLMISDIKTMDPEVHRRWCGGDLGRILQNIKDTAAAGIPLMLRVPVVPGVNDSDENFHALGAFLREELGGKLLLQLLPYRKLGLEKYQSLELEYPMGADYPIPEKEEWYARLHTLADILKEYGVPAVVGAETKAE